MTDVPEIIGDLAEDKVCRPPGWSVLIVALVLFLSGVLTGWGSAAIVVRHHRLSAARHPDKFMKMGLSRELNLTPEQQQQLDAIMTKHQPEMERSHQLYEAATQAVANEIKAILTPTQQKKLEALHQRWEQDHGPKGPPPPPG